jgi:hypothetical protein
MINKDYVLKKQLEELDFLWRHMEREDQIKWLKSARFDVKHRILGRIRCKIMIFVYRFLNAFYL